MSLQIVPQTNNPPMSAIPKTQSKDSSKKQVLKVYQTPEDAPTSVKAGVSLTTLLGVVTAMALTFDKHEMPFKSPKKFWHSLTTVTYEKEKNELEKCVARLAVGSVGGGLLGGALFDKKEHMTAKIRESVIQLVGNIATPLACVSGGMKLYQKCGGKEKSPLSIITSAVCLITGIFLGNKIGNSINLNLFRIDEDRKIKLSDMSPHIDDVGLALSLSGMSDSICRVVPAALMIAGLSTGCMQEHTEVIQAKHDKDLKDKPQINNQTV